MGSCLVSAAVVMWSLITVLCVVMCCLNTVSARPKEEQEEDVSLAETKDPETNPLEDLLAELRDSTVFPVLLNPFQITKLTCGSLLTFYDTGATDATVSVDLCLTALIVAKLLVVVPLLIGDINVLRTQGGIVGLMDLFWSGLAAARLELLTSKSVEEDTDDALKKIGQQETENNNGVSSHYPVHDDFFGFDFNGWEAGDKSFEEDETINGFVDFGVNSVYKRGFPTANVEKVLFWTLHHMDKAVTVTNDAE